MSFARRAQALGSLTKPLQSHRIGGNGVRPTPGSIGTLWMPTFASSWLTTWTATVAEPERTLQLMAQHRDHRGVDPQWLARIQVDTHGQRIGVHGCGGGHTQAAR